jgi:hypothetical protein
LIGARGHRNDNHHRVPMSHRSFLVEGVGRVALTARGEKWRAASGVAGAADGWNSRVKVFGGRSHA